MKKWYQNPPVFVGFVLTLFLLLTLVLLVGAKLHHSDNSLEKKVVLSPSQQAVVNEFRKAKADADKALADLEKSKAEFQQMINDAKVTAIGKNLDPNVPTSWLLQGNYGGQSVYCVSGSNGKPILWGFRSDGLVTWKEQ